MRDAWDYVKARIEKEGVASPRLRRSLDTVAADMAATLAHHERTPGRASTDSMRDNGDDTADDRRWEAFLGAAERLRELAQEVGMP